MCARCALASSTGGCSVPACLGHPSSISTPTQLSPCRYSAVTLPLYLCSKAPAHRDLHAPPRMAKAAERCMHGGLAPHCCMSTASDYPCATPPRPPPPLHTIAHSCRPLALPRHPFSADVAGYQHSPWHQVRLLARCASCVLLVHMWEVCPVACVTWEHMCPCCACALSRDGFLPFLSILKWKEEGGGKWGHWIEAAPLGALAGACVCAACGRPACGGAGRGGRWGCTRSLQAGARNMHEP